jgi:hypothetical protein
MQFSDKFDEEVQNKKTSSESSSKEDFELYYEKDLGVN